jgi:hypothetical protein
MVMIVLQGFSIDVLKWIFEDVEYNIGLLHKEERGDFFGLVFVLSDDKLIIDFSSDNGDFDEGVSPWEILLDRKFEYKVNYLKPHIVYDIIDIFKTHGSDNLKITIDDDLSELKIYNNGELILDYRMQ